jgi:hypothetical protein
MQTAHTGIHVEKQILFLRDPDPANTVIYGVCAPPGAMHPIPGLLPPSTRRDMMEVLDF